MVSNFKKKIINLSYYLDSQSNLTLNNSYCKRLYNSNSFLIDFYIYRHFYYALNIVKLNQEKMILDIGCGDGPFLPSLNKYGKRVIGLDLLLGMISKAKDLINFNKFRLNNVFLLNADGLNLPIKDNTMDIVFCLETFEHIPNTIKLINEIYRILKYDGKLIYSLPIEIGISLIIRQIVGIITNFPRESYNFKELLRNGILKKPSHRINSLGTHKDFDWRVIHRLINKKFKQFEVIYSPLPILKSLNPTIIFKVKKK